MKKFVLAIILTFVANLFLFADIQKSLAVLQDFAYAQNVTSDSAYDFYKAVATEIKENVNEQNIAESLVNLANAEFYIGQIFLSDGKKKTAIGHFESVERLANRALYMERNEQNFDVLIVKAKSLAMQYQLKSIFYAMICESELSSLIDLIIEQDKHNVSAFYLKAAKLIFGPTFTKNQENGRLILQENMIFIPEGDMENEFLYNFAMGYSFLQNKMKEKALPYIRRASEIYPSNKSCAELLK